MSIIHNNLVVIKFLSFIFIITMTFLPTKLCFQNIKSPDRINTNKVIHFQYIVEEDCEHWRRREAAVRRQQLATPEIHGQRPRITVDEGVAGY